MTHWHLTWMLRPAADSHSRIHPDGARLLEPRCIHGHLRVNLSKERVSRLCKVADLVLLAFVGEQPAGARARHRDGDVGNCALENLEWG